MTYLAALWILVYAACAATAFVRHQRRGTRASSAPVEHVPHVLVRPCAGREPDLAARLAQSGGADAVLLAVARDDDGALPAARRAARLVAAAGGRARVVVTGARGPNYKADQIARALGPIGDDVRVVVVADSDVDLGDVDIPSLAAEAARDGVGAVWSPPVEAGLVATSGDAASHAVLGGSLHAFPLLSTIDPVGLVGKLFAIRRDTLQAIGGFEALRHHLGEDMELARRLRARGLPTVVTRDLARSRAYGRSLRTVHDRYARWLAVIRAQRAPLLASYPLLVAPVPALALVACVAVARGDDPLFLVAVAGFVVRLAIARAARAASGTRPSFVRAFADAWVADALLTCALVHAIASRTVRWRSGTFALGTDGRLEEVTR